jgi:hypothetical protein
MKEEEKEDNELEARGGSTLVLIRIMSFPTSEDTIE